MACERGVGAAKPSTRFGSLGPHHRRRLHLRRERQPHPRRRDRRHGLGHRRPPDEPHLRPGWVETEMKGQFPDLKWNPKGVDAVDPATGRQYEILSGTRSNVDRHVKRMADELFRMIRF